MTWTVPVSTAASIAALVSALCAGAAAVLWLSGSRGRLRRLARPGRSRSAPSAWGRWLLPAADRLPTRTRLVAASAVLAAGLVGAHRLGLGVVGVVLAALVAAAVAPALGRFETSAVKARRARLVRDLPQALDLLAACLVAGLPLRAAASAVRDAFDGPLAATLGDVLALVELGAPEAEAWRTLRGHRELGAVAADLSRSVESGTMLVATLNRHADAARAARHAALEIEAKAVGVRSVLPMMLCFIPAFLLLGVVPTVVSALQSALPF